MWDVIMSAGQSHFATSPALGSAGLLGVCHSAIAAMGNTGTCCASNTSNEQLGLELASWVS